MIEGERTARRARSALLVCAPSPRLVGSAPVGTVKLVRAMLAAGWKVDILGCRFEKDSRVDPFFSDLLNGACIYEGHSLFEKPAAWVPTAIRTGNRLLAEGSYDVIVSFAHLAWTHVVALFLRNGKRVPWVAYFTDPWANYPLSTNSPVRRIVERALERRTMMKADALVFTHANMRDFILSPYSRCDRISAKCFAIPYFFDEALYPEAAKPVAEKLVLRHMGNIPQGAYVEAFFYALKLLLNERPALASRLSVEFYGGHRQQHVELVRKLSMQDCVSFHAGVSYQESLRLMCEADLLLLLSMPAEAFGGLGNATLHLKMADYIGAGRPIFALAGKGSPADEAFGRTNGLCGDENPQVIKAALAKFIDQPEEIDPALRDQFSKQSVFLRWEAVFDGVIKKAADSGL